MAGRTTTILRDVIRDRLPAAPVGVRYDRDEIAEVAAIIAERFRPERIVLFGSLAYGGPTAASDVDLMIVMDPSASPVEQTVSIRQAVARVACFPTHILVRTPASVQCGMAEGDFFIRDVMTKGVTLYDRGVVDLTTGPPVQNGGPGEEPGLKHATQGWVTKAENDYLGATRLIADTLPLYDLVCFHAQQCVETYLKALLQERDIPFPRTHELVERARLADPVVPALAAHTHDLGQLTECAVDARDPEVRVTEARAEEAMRIASDARLVLRGALGL